MEAAKIDGDLVKIVATEDELNNRIREIGAQISEDYKDLDQPLLLIAVLKGAVMVMADLARAIDVHVQFDFMAVSSYGSGTKSSGVVRIIKDLDVDLAGRHVLIVEDILDSGLTLSWLIKNLKTRNPASMEVMTMFRKPDAIKVEVPARYIGFDIPSEFVVGYGLDYAERYRNLREVAVLNPAVYSGK